MIGKWIWFAGLIALLGVPTRAFAQAEGAEPAETAPAETAPAESATAQTAAPETGAAEAGAAESEPSSEAAQPVPAQETVPPPTDAAPRAARVAQPAPGSCAGRAREVALDAVVRVRSGDRWGAGFVYGSPRHVVTSFGLMSRGRPVTVVARDGSHIAARLLARDEALDLAVLETTEPIPGAAPLQPAPETSAMVGQPVVALGHPFGQVAGLLGERGEGLLRWSVAEGTVGAVNEVGVQADVALTEGHEGGPLLDCQGRVIGMIAGGRLHTEDIGLVARIARVDALIEGAGPAGDFIGDLALKLGIGGALLIDQDGRTAGGVYVTLGATLFDRVSWMNRVGFFMGGAPDPAADVLSLERRQIRIESMLGWRFFLDIGGFTTFYIVPSAGLTVTHEDVDTRRARVVEGCTASATESCIAIDELSAESWHVRPAVGLTFIAGDRIELGYTLEIEVEGDVTTFHTVALGMFF